MMHIRTLSFIGLAWIGIVLVPMAARSQDGASVLVQLATLQHGSLPQTVTAYGVVRASAPAQRTVMAPTAAIVDEVYVRSGEEVDKGAPLLRLQPTPETASLYAQAESAVRVAADRVDRTRKMVAQHLATAQQLLDAEKAASDARAALQALQLQGAGGPNLVRAPFRAVVTSVATSPGGIVSGGATLLSLANPGGLVLEVGTLPRQAALVKADDPATIAPLGQTETLAGKVLLRGSMIDPATGMIPIQIAFPAGKLLFGQSATASITTGEFDGYIVPHEAILADDRGDPYVVQAPHMVAKRVSVRVLETDGSRDLIDGPLDPKVPLVLSGNYQLQDGMKVRIADPPAKTSP
jgi:RND family efflux transporter MFP subunit